MKKTLPFMKVALLPVVFMATMISVHSQSSTPKPPGLPANAIPSRVIDDPSPKPSGWQRYQFGASPGFSVILPSAPAVSSEVAGGQVINTYISSTGSAFYAVTRVDRIELSLETASEKARNDYFKGFFQGFAKSFEAPSAQTQDSLHLLDVTKVRAAGRDGFEQRLTYKTWLGRGQMVFVEDSAFCVIALWLPSVPAADYDSFFQSFRIERAAN
jgi:hypothetical protein